MMTKLKSDEQEQFDDYFKVASKADIHGVKVPLLHINQLIFEKRNIAHYKELEDAEAL